MQIASSTARSDFYFRGNRLKIFIKTFWCILNKFLQFYSTKPSEGMLFFSNKSRSSLRYQTGFIRGTICKVVADEKHPDCKKKNRGIPFGTPANFLKRGKVSEK